MRKLKKLLAVVLVLTMAVSILGTSAVAAGAEGVTRTGFASFYPNTNTYNVVSGGYAENGRGTVVLSDTTPTATDHAYTEYYGSHYQGWAKGFTWLTVEQNTNPGVATATVMQGTYSNGRPCLDVTFTKGSQKGTTTIVIGYTVTELHVEAGIATDSDTSSAISGYIYYTVTNGDGGSTGPENPGNKPAPPRGGVFKVQILCNETPDHSAQADFMDGENGGWTVGEVVANDGSRFSSTTYPWQCTFTLINDFWVKMWNDDWASEDGVHYLASENAESITFYYNNATKGWQFSRDDHPLHVYITHKAPAAEKFTVTYTDGVEDEVVFDDQSYTVEEGAATPAFQFNGVSGAEPTREGYKFEGWAPTVASTVTENATYEATWSKVEEPKTNITVKFNDGEAGGHSFAEQVYYPEKNEANDYLYLFNSDPEQLASVVDGKPLWNGHTFTEWEKAVAENGNVTYTAQWEEVKPEIPQIPFDVLKQFISKVYVDCVTVDDTEHATEGYDLIDGSYESTAFYDATNGYGTSEKRIDVTIYANQYVAAYNSNIPGHVSTDDSTSVTVTFSYNDTLSGNSRWQIIGSDNNPHSAYGPYVRTATFNVEHEVEEPPVETAPTYDDLKDLLHVHIYDTTEVDGKRLHGEKTYDLMEETYAVSAPVDGKYTVTVTTAQYVEKFNADVRTTHTVDEETVSAVVFKDTDGKWKVDGTPVSVNHTISVAVKCKEPKPETHTYTLTFNANGGEFEAGKGGYNFVSDSIRQKVDTTAAGSYTFTQDMINGQTPPVRDGYIFQGWTTDQDNASTIVTDVTVTKDSPNATIYALWAEDANNNGVPDDDEKITVTFENGQGNTLEKYENVLPRTDGNYEDLYTGENPTREGYVFDGWSDPVTDENGNVTYTAQWKCDGNHVDEDGDGKCDKDGCDATNHTVTYTDGVDGEVFADQSYTVWSDDEVQDPAFNSGETKADVDTNGNPVREGYVFTEWNTVTDENGNVTHTAQWAVDANRNGTPDDEEYTVTFDPNGGNWNGSADPETRTVAPGGSLEGNMPEDPTRSGYWAFEGWFTDPTNGTEFDPNAPVTGDTTVYAHWRDTTPPTPPTPTVTYYDLTVEYVDGEGNTIRDAETSTHPSGYAYDVDAPEIEGYTFDHAEGETAGTLTSDTTVTLVYTAVEEIPDPEPPLTEDPDPVEPGEPDPENPGTTEPDPEDPGTTEPDPGEELPDEDVPKTDEPGTDIPDEDVPKTDEPGTDIPDEDVPKTDEPGTDEPTEEIPDEDVPLDDVPKTGDDSCLPVWALLTVLSALGLGYVALPRRKKN